jgi:hypothetical protein
MSVPSAWPVRNERRQAAVSRDMNKVEARLLRIESSLELISGKLRDVCNIIQNDMPTSKQLMAPMETCDPLESRIDKLELLLLRTSLEDFRTLDRDIIKFMPRIVESASIEPDFEAYPVNLPIPNDNTEYGACNKCLYFEIDDEDELCADDAVEERRTERDKMNDIQIDKVNGMKMDKGELTDPVNDKGFKEASHVEASLDDIRRLFSGSAQQLRQDILRDVSEKVQLATVSRVSDYSG